MIVIFEANLILKLPGSMKAVTMGSVGVPSGDIPWCENFKSDLAHLPVRLKGGVRILADLSRPDFCAG